MTAAAFDPFAAAAAFGCTNGPVAHLAAGKLPDCYAALRQYLAARLRDARATLAVMGSEEDGGDPYWDSGRQEVAEILAATDRFHRWASDQVCLPEHCVCRADRVLRRELVSRGMSVKSAYRPDQAGLPPVSVIVTGAADPEVRVLVDHRSSIDHMVRLHHGWRARLSTPDRIEVLYRSPLYPRTPVRDYGTDTRACVEAIAVRLAAEAAPAPGGTRG